MNVMSSSTIHNAVREHGICKGTLWREQAKTKAKQGGGGGGGPSTSNLSFSSSSDKTCDYCILAGARIRCYETLAAWDRGDAPVCSLKVVGASSCTAGSPSGGGGSGSGSGGAGAGAGSNTSGGSSSSMTNNNNSSSSSSTETSFRLVTDQGTHVYGHAPTNKCRDLWLATIHAGLEQSLLEQPLDTSQIGRSLLPGGSGSTSTSSQTSKLTPPPPNARTLKRLRIKRSCLSCGVSEGAGSSSTSSNSNSGSSSTNATAPRTILLAAAPVWQYGREGRCDLCTECFHAQGLLDHVEFIKDCLSAAQQERQALEQARNLCSQVTMQVQVVAPDDEESESAIAIASGDSVSATTAPAAVTEVAATDSAAADATTTDPSTATEEPDHSDTGSWSQVGGSDGSPSSATNSPPPMDGDTVASPAPSSPSAAELTGSWHAVAEGEGVPAAAAAAHQQSSSNNAWINVPPTATSTKALMDLLADRVQFGPLMRVSPFLNSIVHELSNGLIGVADFLEQLDDAVGSTGKREADSLTELKKQAFRVAGDMGSAMKQILDHALPSKQVDNYYCSNTGTDMLACILEFLLDLCEEEELNSVAFFWPQLCHIHLRMLPPKNSAEQRRVDLVEDFLLTVATRYSVHLALELIWSHTADLEESLSSAPCPSSCRRRRYAVLRFVCELESLLFDFDGGWGGGSVSLGKMLAATGDQMNLLKEMMKQVQALRKDVPEWLTRSARIDMLSNSNATLDDAGRPSEAAVQEKLRIAKNADYFSSHLSFTKRICDVAEKLRFMEVEERAQALQGELDLLNSSGAMGGDPLNEIKEHLVRVVRVPSTEGHVFRSKERTPVLLLMEIVGQGADEIASEGKASKKYDKRPETLSSTVDSDSAEPQTLQSTSSQESKVESKDNMEAVELDSSEQSGDEAPASPASPKASALSGDSEGSPDALKSSPRDSPLKRLDSTRAILTAGAPTTPRRDVELLVTNVMEQQTQGLDLPDLGDTSSYSDVAAGESTGKDASTTRSGVDPSYSPNNKESVEKKGSKRMLGAAGDSNDQAHALAPTSDVRREVLNAIMMTGMQGNSIAAGAADSVQRSLKELERQRATELLLGDGGEGSPEVLPQDAAYAELESTSQRLASLGIGIGSNNTNSRSYDGDEIGARPTEEDEAMEAIRLLLIQNQVAQGSLSPLDAAKVLQHASLNRIQSTTKLSALEEGVIPEDESEMPTIDAGDIDARLVGCGPLPAAVLQALTLWKVGMVTNGELLELVKKDIEFVRHSVLLDSENMDKLNENSAFWGRFAFGERWAEKRARIAATSPEGSTVGWDLTGVIVKSNDDLRQEAFVMQLIELCQEAFELAGLELWVNPYRILATGRTTGVIEMVRNAMSFDALKKRPGYGKGGLREHLLRMTEFTADPGEAFKSAQSNFVRSLAAYSLMSYFFLFKDRHNGNLLLDTAGHVIHIDFGFVFGVAPGGSFSLEMSTPFKLTEEMLEVMGGLKSPLFSEFVTLFCCGFLALQSYCDTFLTIVEIMSKNSTFKCFEGREPAEVVSKLRERFVPDLNKEATVAFALDLIKLATSSYGTKQYDYFQYLSQGIAA